MSYAVHTIDTVPDRARETLAIAEKSFGFVPNLLGTMAETPELLKAYLAVGALFDQTSFTPIERQIVMLATSYENDCEYCMGAHTAIASMQKVPDEIVQAVRDGRPIADPKLEALRRLTSAVVVSRGWPNEADIAAFHRAGYGHAQVLEVILGIGLKTFANYVNHITGTPLDKTFSKVAWKKPE